MISLENLFYIILRQNDHYALSKKNDSSMFQGKLTKYSLLTMPLHKIYIFVNATTLRFI